MNAKESLLERGMMVSRHEERGVECSEPERQCFPERIVLNQETVRTYSPRLIPLLRSTDTEEFRDEGNRSVSRGNHKGTRKFAVPSSGK